MSNTFSTASYATVRARPMRSASLSASLILFRLWGVVSTSATLGSLHQLRLSYQLLTVKFLKNDHMVSATGSSARTRVRPASVQRCINPHKNPATRKGVRHCRTPLSSTKQAQPSLGSRNLWARARAFDASLAGTAVSFALLESNPRRAPTMPPEPGPPRPFRSASFACRASSFARRVSVADTFPFFAYFSARRRSRSLPRFPFQDVQRHRCREDVLFDSAVRLERLAQKEEGHAPHALHGVRRNPQRTDDVERVDEDRQGGPVDEGDALDPGDASAGVRHKLSALLVQGGLRLEAALRVVLEQEDPEGGALVQQQGGRIDLGQVHRGLTRCRGRAGRPPPCGGGRRSAAPGRLPP